MRSTSAARKLGTRQLRKDRHEEKSIVRDGPGPRRWTGTGGVFGSARGLPALPHGGQTLRCGQAPAAGSTVLASTMSTDGDRPALITAQAVGTVTGTPDVLTVSLGVRDPIQTRLGTALAKNNRLAGDVIAVIKNNGVAPEDLQTSQLTINPTFDDVGRVTGYQVTNMVTARLRDVAAAGALIDAVGAAAGDGDPGAADGFAIDDDSALRAAARADAVRRAQAQAQQLADAAGVRHSVRSVPSPRRRAPAQIPYGATSYDTAAEWTRGADRGRQPGADGLGAGGVRDRLSTHPEMVLGNTSLGQERWVV